MPRTQQAGKPKSMPANLNGKGKQCTLSFSPSSAADKPKRPSPTKDAFAMPGLPASRMKRDVKPEVSASSAVAKGKARASFMQQQRWKEEEREQDAQQQQEEGSSGMWADMYAPSNKVSQSFVSTCRSSCADTLMPLRRKVWLFTSARLQRWKAGCVRRSQVRQIYASTG